jgi:hypothetical protein
MDIEVFVAYMQTHFPNYECARAIRNADEITRSLIGFASTATAFLRVKANALSHVSCFVIDLTVWQAGVSALQH